MRAEPGTWSGAFAARLADGRLHLQEGPIDVVVEALPRGLVAERAFAAATGAFAGILGDLAAVLPHLRRPLDDGWPDDASPTAQRMRRAVRQFPGVFVTPMAAVAGSVADTVLDAMRDVTGLEAAYVNNRGDIALHVTAARPLTIGVVAALEGAGIGAGLRIDAASGVGGVATSGWSGRSFSLGIADAVTVLAADAATADTAATLVASAVDVDDPAIERRAASDLDPDSDLGDRLVTVAVGPLAPSAIDEALTRGADLARRWIEAGTIMAALLALQGRASSLGPPAALRRIANRNATNHERTAS